MRKHLFGALLVVLLFGLLASSVPGSDEFPAHRGQINDFADLIPPDVEQRMEAKARQVLNTTGTSVVVVTMPTIGENYLSDYVNRLYRAWGVGKKGENKGVLIFFAQKEKKIRIETGYGVEGILPDGKVGEILRRDVAPHLKKKDYGTGLENALLSVSRVIEEDAKASGGVKPTPKKPPVSPHTVFIVATFIVFGIIGLIVFLIVMIKKGGRRMVGSDNRYEPISSTSSFSSGDSGSSDSGSSDSGGFDGGDSGGGGAECSTDD
ncbi:MAG: TPM domain-containing protein [Syntrophaceae bacterium]|nr:TPM domain-containing protein [Syntrophaceae bacterium]